MSHTNHQRPRRMVYTGSRRYEETAGPAEDNTSDASGPNPSTTPARQEPIQRRIGYTMIQPKEEKRNRLLEIARRETEQAEARREQRRSIPVRERPQAAGGLRTYDEVMRQKQQANNVSPAAQALQQKAKREKWVQQKKDKEEREIQEKKAKARAQAEKNERIQREHQARQSEEVRRRWNARYN